MRSWISRSFKNALVLQLVCVGALSSCHHRFDVSVSRCAMQCGTSVLVRTPSPTQHGGKTMPFTNAAPTVPGLRWLCSLMHTSGSRSALSCGPPVGSNHPNRTVLARSGVTPVEELLNRRTPRASGPRASNAVCRGSRARPCAARHGKKKFNRAKRFSAVNRGARTG